MGLTVDERRALLDRARDLRAEGDHAALVAALDDLSPDELLAEPEFGVLLVFGRRRVGEPEAAFDLVRRLEPVCTRRGNDRVARMRLNLEAALLFERGAVGEAREVWLRLLESASEADDAEFVAHANNNIGMIHTLQGPGEEAVVSYERAIASYRRLGDRRGLAQAQHNLAMAYRELGFLREADAHFRNAVEYARAAGSADVVARAEQNRSLALVLRGDVGLAEATATRALRRFEALEEPAGIGECHWALGVIFLARAARPAAREHLRKALRSAKRVRNALLEAETLEALAVIERADGDASRGRALRERADELFKALGAQRWGARTRERLATLSALESTFRPLEPDRYRDDEADPSAD